MKKKKLTTQQINSIIDLYESGIGSVKIGRELRVGKKIVINTLKENSIPIIGTKRYFSNENYFENIDTEEKAYWLGFLFADGYVRIRKEKYGEVKLKLQLNDIKHIELFKKSLKSTNIIKIYNNPYRYKDKTKMISSASISIYSTKMVNDLIKLGCVEKKSKVLYFPIIKKELTQHFIRGYFDGDGSIYLNKKNRLEYYICSGSRHFLSSIQKVFNSIGITQQSLSKNSNGVYLLRSYRINDLKRIYNYFYNESSIFIERKKMIFENVNNFKEGVNKWIK